MLSGSSARVEGGSEQEAPVRERGKKEGEDERAAAVHHTGRRAEIERKKAATRRENGTKVGRKKGCKVSGARDI